MSSASSSPQSEPKGFAKKIKNHIMEYTVKAWNTIKDNGDESDSSNAPTFLIFDLKSDLDELQLILSDMFQDSDRLQNRCQRFTVSELQKINELKSRMCSLPQTRVSHDYFKQSVLIILKSSNQQLYARLMSEQDCAFSAFYAIEKALKINWPPTKLEEPIYAEIHKPKVCLQLSDSPNLKTSKEMDSCHQFDNEDHLINDATFIQPQSFLVRADVHSDNCEMDEDDVIKEVDETLSDLSELQTVDWDSISDVYDLQDELESLSELPIDDERNTDFNETYLIDAAEKYNSSFMDVDILNKTMRLIELSDSDDDDDN